MKRTIKILSLVLAVVMLVSIIPLSASATTTEIGSVSLRYNFDEGDVISLSKNNFDSGTSDCFTLNKVEWEDANCQGLSTTYRADNKADPEGYKLTVELKANANCEFSSSVSVRVNGVSLTKKAPNITENQFKVYKVVGKDDHYLQFTVNYRYLFVDTFVSYGSQLDRMAQENSGYYIKDEIVDLYTYN